MAKSVYTKWIIAVALCIAGFLIWSANKKSSTMVMRHEFTGVVVAIHPKTHQLSVHNQEIPGTMREMDMDYDVKDAAALSNLKVGETIHATLVSDGDNMWQLEDVTVTQKK